MDAVSATIGEKQKEGKRASVLTAQEPRVASELGALMQPGKLFFPLTLHEQAKPGKPERTI